MRSPSTTLAALGVSLLALTACGAGATGTAVPDTNAAAATTSATESDRPTPPSTSADEPTTTPRSTTENRSTEADPTSEEPTDDTTDAEPTASPSGGGNEDQSNRAPWAEPLHTPGVELGTVQGPEVSITVYQAGTAPAPSRGGFVDPDTGKPLIEVGDEVVWMAFKVTNTSDHTLQLGHALVTIDPRYVDWEWMQGMDSIVDFDLDEQMGINRNATAEYHEDGIYLLEPGEAFTQSENFKYQAGTELVLRGEYTPVDDAGELLFDQSVDFEGSVVVQ